MERPPASIPAPGMGSFYVQFSHKENEASSRSQPAFESAAAVTTGCSVSKVKATALPGTGLSPRGSTPLSVGQRCVHETRSQSLSLRPVHGSASLHQPEWTSTGPDQT